MTPVAVLAVCHKDIAQACAWLRWTCFLTTQADGDLSGETLLIFLTQRAERLGLTALVEACDYVHQTYRIQIKFAVCPDEDERGYPGSSSHHFLRVMEHCEREYPGRPVLFCEPDTTVTRPTWFREIADEYAGHGGGVMGAQVDHKAIEGWHASGNSAYPHNWRELIPSLLTVLSAPNHHLWPSGCGQPWDTWCAAEVRACFHRTDLIQQIFHCSTISRDNLHLVQPKTAIFHRLKDSSLIATLARTRYHAFAATLPACSRYFSTTRHPSQLAIHGYRFTGWITIKRPSGQTLSIIAPTDPLDELVLGCLVGSKGVSELTADEWERLT